MIRTAAKAAAVSALILAAPLALAQSIVPTGSGTTDYTSPSTQTNTTSTGTNTTTGSGTSGTTTRSGTTGTSSTPGVPNTGAGGNAATNMAVLLLSGAMAAGGIAYLARTRSVWA